MKKICPHCQENKMLSYFFKDKKSKDGHTTWCKKCKIIKQREWYLKRPKLSRNIHLKIKRLEEKKSVMSAYGGKCICCGESELLFLSIDHINNDGSSDRKLKVQGGKGGNTFYKWLIKNNYPKDKYQILCFNCNLAKGFYGKCPHNNIVS